MTFNCGYVAKDECIGKKCVFIEFLSKGVLKYKEIGVISTYTTKLQFSTL
jgi:hypothetical protein